MAKRKIKERGVEKARDTESPIDDSLETKGGGAGSCATDSPPAPAPNNDVPEICLEIRQLHATREQYIKAAITIENTRAGVVRNAIGFKTTQDETEREKGKKAAQTLIAAVLKGNPNDHPELSPLIIQMEEGIKAPRKIADDHGKLLSKMVKALPVSSWVVAVRGFGLINFARIIGEAGDLSLYSNPGKLWKRLGLAPFQKGGVNKMPSTWRREGGLNAEEWTAVGYSPRRRAIAFVLGECMLKANKGPYRQRYDEAKERFKANRPDCKDIHAHKHAMLCMVKRLIKDLWVEWNKKPVS